MKMESVDGNSLGSFYGVFVSDGETSGSDTTLLISYFHIARLELLKI
jgi:hypothetical protein